ncbi:hypothetical protein EC991_006086 [Linnemannia zychae]|nr:hypothetical protein EC991_006086 [Linnemannia zychae]
MMTPCESPNEAIDGTRPLSLSLIEEAAEDHKAKLQENDDEEEEKLIRRHHHHLSVITTPITPTRTLPLKAESAFPYPAAPAQAVLLPAAQYTPPPSASGRSKQKRRNSFFATSPSPSNLTVPMTTTPKATLAAIPMAVASPTAAAAIGTSASPTTATTTNPTAKKVHSSLERAQFINLTRHRKVGSGLITVFCIAAIVILILC